MQNLGLDYFQRRQAWRTGIGLRLRLMERWAQSHDLLNLESANRIADILSRLDSDTLSVAFVGEVSRGKSELINAMFFGSYAHHLLPVGPGRTTLCPTEIKSQGQSSPSLQLLPIQTTADPRPLLAWQDDPQAWTHTGLTTDDTKQLAEDLLRITLTTSQDAVSLQTKPVPEQGVTLPQAAIAQWRYAIVNLPHPLLDQGLRILDMPGLNAWGEEPERALSLLTNCDVLVFLLSAETGVSASELALWQQHLAKGEGKRCERLVVLNKADVFWDAQHDPSTIDRQLQQQRIEVAAALGIAPEHVVSVSARKALEAKGTSNAALLASSNLPKLEELLWKTLISGYDQRRQQGLSNALALCKAALEQVLHARAQELKQEKERMLARARPSKAAPRKPSGDEEKMQIDQAKERLKIQVIESTLLGLLGKIRTILQMPDLATNVDMLDQKLRRSEGLPSVRRAYEQLQKDIQAQWKLVQEWCDEMGHLLAASVPATDRRSGSTHQSPAPLQLAAYAALLKQALHGHIQFLGSSQVHKLRQADFTAKLVTAVRATITDISQQMCRSCEDWYDEATKTLRQTPSSSQTAARQEPAQTSQTTEYLLNQLQAREDQLGQLNQTLHAYFLALAEANSLD